MTVAARSVVTRAAGGGFPLPRGGAARRMEARRVGDAAHRRRRLLRSAQRQARGRPPHDAVHRRRRPRAHPPARHPHQRSELPCRISEVAHAADDLERAHRRAWTAISSPSPPISSATVSAATSASANMSAATATSCKVGRRQLPHQGAARAHRRARAGLARLGEFYLVTQPSHLPASPLEAPGESSEGHRRAIGLLGRSESSERSHRSRLTRTSG